MTVSKKEQPRRLLPLDSDQIGAVLSQPDHIRQAYGGILFSLAASDTLQTLFDSSEVIRILTLTVPFPKMDGKVEPTFGGRSRAEAEAVSQPRIDMKFRRNAHRLQRLYAPLHSAP